MASSFVHLHLHTEYSMLDGAARVPDVVATAVADGQPAVGITDHGNMYGVLDFYTAARDAGIKPIIGMEAYFVATSRFDRPRRDEHDIFHLTLLAENEAGYRNLMKISSLAYLEGFFYKPRVDFELLERYRDGIIATSGCLGSAVCQRLLVDDDAGARELAGQFQDVVGREPVLRRAPRPRARRPAPGQPVAGAHRPRPRRARCSPRTTATTPTVTTPKPTTPCCACRPPQRRMTPSD